MTWLRFLVLFCVVAMIGCGPGSTAVKAPEISPKDKVKGYLEEMAKTGGGGGSAMGALMQECSKLEETDAALAQEVRKEVQNLMSTGSSSDQIKEKAKELLTKFGGATGG